MERTGSLPSMSQIEACVGNFKLKSRPGQMRAFRAISEHDRKLCIKLPTGYGKTYVAAGSYSILKACGMVNRMLIVLPTVAQRRQFEQTVGADDYLSAFRIDGPKYATDVGDCGYESIRRHASDKCQFFTITVQSLIGSRGMDNVHRLLQKGRWLVVVDEYHHYGIDKPFGDAINRLNHEYLLCMSATPYRPDDDGAFGEPSVTVTYREAVKDRAVKPLCGHAYHYKIDAIDEGGEVLSYTTEELIREAGGSSPEQIERLKISKKIRWSPKYVSPLITHPLGRLMAERVRTGRPLQAIIGCMCVSHAKLVFEQVSSAFPELRVGWVGTGTNGRSDEENGELIDRFCPKNECRPTLDVLVHVGMAGEGLDTVNVSEVVHLNAAGVNNANNQENGRAARFLVDAHGEAIVGNINFDGCSGYAKGDYVGYAVMDAMDNLPPTPDADDKDMEPSERDDEWLELPEEPEVQIVNVECISIDSGDETVIKMANALKGLVVEFRAVDLDDKNNPVYDAAIQAVREMRRREAEEHNETSVVAQLQEQLNMAVGVLTGNVVKLMKSRGVRVEKSLIGDIKKRINGRKIRDLGKPVAKDAALLREHYNWVKRLEESIRSNMELPSWLL